MYDVLLVEALFGMPTIRVLNRAFTGLRRLYRRQALSIVLPALNPARVIIPGFAMAHRLLAAPRAAMRATVPAARAYGTNILQKL